MDRFFHSVTLDKDKCKGCTNCIKRCPTEAIRVRGGKAVIMSERCIDCSVCIRVCPYHAKKARPDPIESIEKFKYKIALPAPTLYGQFNNLDDIDTVLTGLKKIGFDHVFEVSRGAEIISEATRRVMSEGKIPKPVISSACPAVVRLIRVRFPDLCENVLPLKAPMETAAIMAKRESHEQTGLPLSDIGVFFITPCAAKVTDIKMPIGIEHSAVDGAIAISDIYPALVGAMNKLDGHTEALSHSGIIGVGWAGIGGESAALLNEQYLAADGIENVIKVLEELEDERLSELDFIELNACPGGCVGGVFTVENPYVARARIQKLRKYLPVSCNHLSGEAVPSQLKWTSELEFAPVLNLADNVVEAMERMTQAQGIAESLPGLDCGSCGAPSCRALAEDIVLGQAKESDCIFKMRERIQSIANQLTEIEGYVPHPSISPKEGDSQ